MKQATLAVYRALHRQARQLTWAGQKLEVRAPLDLNALSKHQWVPGTEGWRVDTLRALLPGLLEYPPTGSLSREEVRDCIRANFRTGASRTEPEDQGQLLDLAFAALRVLSEQSYLAACSSTATTQGVFVEMTSTFRLKLTPETAPGALKDGDPDRYLFLYRCRLENVGERRVQLLGRHWVIADTTGQTHTVPKGSVGVVGCTPVLKPGDCFQYYSGTDVNTKDGTMHGSFQMVFLDELGQAQEQFDAVVAPFRLIGK